MNMKKIFAALSAVVVMAGCLCSCTSKKEVLIPHRYASAEEGRELMMANKEYYASFTKNELDFKMQKTGATLDEYLEFACDQVQDFTDSEISFLDSRISKMEKTLRKNGYTLPQFDEIVFIKTTMKEESGGPTGYTHGTQIYIGSEALSTYTMLRFIPGFSDAADTFLWHELFHCLTRNNPEFRQAMYSLINFTVTDSDYELPPSVLEYHITNPDVEHHNSYATFVIDGNEVDCFTDYVTTKHFDEAQSTFYSCDTTALIPVDGTDIYYTPEQASNFDDIFGTNTGYVIDPEECMADNFALAMCFGTKGRDKEGYPNPEIIEGIIDYLQK